MKLFFTGDIAKQTTHDSFLSVSLQKQIAACDCVIGNLEAQIPGKDEKAIKKCGPILSQDKQIVYLLKKAGFTHLTIANNHIMDYGLTGLKDTLQQLSGNLEFTGASDNAEKVYLPSIFEKEGIKIALFAAAEFGFGVCPGNGYGGYAYIQAETLKQQIMQAKKSGYICILSIHAGLEDISYPLPEWKKIYKDFCNVGVDVIIGHHPHVPQGFERYHTSLIFYSLGNFYFDHESMLTEKYTTAYSVLLDITHIGITYKIIWHRLCNNQVSLLEENSEQEKYLTSLLNSSTYETNCNQEAKVFWEQVYRKYYSVFQGPEQKFWNFFLHKLKKRLKFPLEKYSKLEENIDLWMQHNLLIESHIFIQQRALKNIYCEQYPYNMKG